MNRKYPHILKLHNTCLDNHLGKRKLANSKVNNYENETYQHLWHATNSVIIRKSVTLKAYLKRRKPINQ